MISLVRFIVRYFILFDAVVNGVVFPISHSESSLLVYRNATYSCTLILYPATLLNSFITSSSFLVVLLGFSMYSIMSSENSGSFKSFFPFSIPFTSFSSLIAVGRTSKTMLNKSGETGHPHLVSDLRGNAFSFSPFSIMLAVGLSYIDFIMLRYVPSVPVSGEFLSQMNVEFYQKLFLCLLK